MIANDVPVVIYGAGRRAGLALNEIKAMQLNVACFCDFDAQKQGGYAFGLPIFSIDEVISKYNDFVVYISPAAPLKYEISNYLTESCGLEREQILNYVESKKYLSCVSLESTLVVGAGFLSCCCGDGRFRNPPLKIRRGDSIEKDIDNIFKLRDKTIEDNQNPDIRTNCTGCPELREYYWKADRKISSIPMDLPYPCQFACVYCSHPDTTKRYKAKANTGSLDDFQIPKMFEYLKKKNIMSDDVQIGYASGELTVTPNRDEIIDALAEFSHVHILSNAGVYNEKVSQIIKRPSSLMNVSIDSGTRETFAKVKGLDAFDKVVANLKRYEQEGGHITLKYIFLDENANDADVDGFIEIAKDINVQSITISRNLFEGCEIRNKNIISAAIRMAQKANEFGIPIIFNQYFDSKSMEIINKALSKALSE